jgi:AcrR family transcriptional regulator
MLIYTYINKSKENKLKKLIKKSASIAQDNKAEKEEKLLNEGFKLFTTKGFINTSIQDIVNKANVAKGTFYLYFKDKYQLRDVLITKKARKLFNDALTSLNNNYIEDFSDQIIYIINYVIDELNKDPLLLQFISKDLGWGVFNKTLLNLYSISEEEENGMYDLFIKGVEKNNLKLANPRATLFMIIELVSSTIFTSILYKEPLPIKEYKPILYNQIRNMLKNS